MPVILKWLFSSLALSLKTCHCPCCSNLLESSSSFHCLLFYFVSLIWNRILGWVSQQQCQVSLLWMKFINSCDHSRLPLLNVATRKPEILSVTCILFLLDSTALDHSSPALGSTVPPGLLLISHLQPYCLLVLQAGASHFPTLFLPYITGQILRPSVLLWVCAL